MHKNYNYPDTNCLRMKILKLETLLSASIFQFIFLPLHGVRGFILPPITEVCIEFETCSFPFLSASYSVEANECIHPSNYILYADHMQFPLFLNIPWFIFFESKHSIKSARFAEHGMKDGNFLFRHIKQIFSGFFLLTNSAPYSEKAQINSISSEQCSFLAGIYCFVSLQLQLECQVNQVSFCNS